MPAMKGSSLMGIGSIFSDKKMIRNVAGATAESG